ncbi:type IX secretion system membrane protein, PorP/SprF family [Arenibacter nanhaiticus]|uniref:Type IX secretion system membrane protein, PorP/SprF family n=1 Tax=Arenibacter nanhaiticus TaxID=558155 RepID=A0A1M6M6B3_9FLAO|nr:type IX secretion system membrane protein PorP/SprF [Arenibacter nanhaiticus]SHJ78992.1 type IX secretion system membrane protein, PorP/SprF family [Arenibacter nanhaiticus]
MGNRTKGIPYRRFFIFCIIFCSATLVVMGQKEPQYTQYMYNIGSFNPAYVGTVETTDMSGLYREQWSGIPGAPRTIRFGLNIPLANEKHGLGFNIISDELGPTSQTYVDFAYSFQVMLSQETKLSFGIDAGGSLLNVDYTKGDFENPNEPLVTSDKFNKFYPTLGAGVFLYEEDWYLGLSVPNFLTNGIYADEVATIVEDKMQFNFIGGYVFELSENLKFKPAFLLNYLNGSPLNTNLSANFLISDLLTLGASYRWDNAVSGLAGIQISKGTFLGYSYDYNTNGLAEYSQGSHEVILKFYFGRGDTANKEKRQDQKGKPKQIDSPRFF